MAAPSRFPSGVTNVDPTDPLHMFGLPDPTKWHVYFTDFDEYNSTDNWTETATSGGTGTSATSLADVNGGAVRITTAANENDGLFAEKNGESFLIETGKKAFIKARFRVGDAAQSDLIIGLHSTDATPLDATLRFAFISEDGSASLFFNVDDDTTDADSDSVATLADDTWITVTAYYDGKGTISLYADGVKVATMTDVDVPGDNMAVGFGYLNGAAGAETTDFDYLLAAVER